jgi:glycosyltransferase involved in cell wall biosynthesis
MRAALRSQWGIPADAFCFLFVGKFVHKKRPLDIIQAARLLQARTRRPIHLLWVGTGELDKAVRANCSVAFDAYSTERAQASSRPADVRASFAGFLNQSEIASAYVAADCLVVPSEATETWGLVVNEAMACGLPAIVSDAVGCAPDLVRPHRPDLCFPMGNVSGLAEAMASCLVRPPQSSEIAEIISRYDISATVETAERLYASAIASGRILQRA